MLIQIQDVFIDPNAVVSVRRSQVETMTGVFVDVTEIGLAGGHAIPVSVSVADVVNVLEKFKVSVRRLLPSPHPGGAA